MANNRICKVCGTEYKFCPNCNENLANPKPSWYKLYDSEECKTIFETAVKVSCEVITPLEAKEILKNCDLNKAKEADLIDVLETIKNAKKPVKELSNNIVKEL